MYKIWLQTHSFLYYLEVKNIDQAISVSNLSTETFHSSHIIITFQPASTLEKNKGNLIQLWNFLPPKLQQLGGSVTGNIASFA